MRVEYSRSSQHIIDVKTLEMMNNSVLIFMLNEDEIIRENNYFSNYNFCFNDIEKYM